MSIKIWVVIQTWTGYQDDGAPIAVYQGTIETVKSELAKTLGTIEWDEFGVPDDGMLSGTYKPISEYLNDDKLTNECTLMVYQLEQLNTIDFKHVTDDGRGYY